MKIITCAGYYRTGSSAVTDFFSEFDNCKSLGITEVRILQDPYGISNLETNIIEHPHRHNTSHAIKKFIDSAKFENGNFISKRYKSIFGDIFMKATLQYVNDITQCKCRNHWRYDVIEKGNFIYMLNSLLETCYEKISHGQRKSFFDNEFAYYTGIKKEEFYKATKKYTSTLFSSICCNAEYIMVDQLAAPHEASRYLNYIDDMYIIIVERDPRDLWILESMKYRWGVIPQDNVNDFCTWYKITREHRKHEKDNERVCFIYLEDLIYKYDETSKFLIKFVGNNKIYHTHIKDSFNPDISIKGTRVWEKYPDKKKEIDIIERELSEYLYEY